MFACAVAAPSVAALAAAPSRASVRCQAAAGAKRSAPQPATLNCATEKKEMCPAMLELFDLEGPAAKSKCIHPQRPMKSACADCPRRKLRNMQGAIQMCRRPTLRPLLSILSETQRSGAKRSVPCPGRGRVCLVRADAEGTGQLDAPSQTSDSPGRGRGRGRGPGRGRGGRGQGQGRGRGRKDGTQGMQQFQGGEADPFYQRVLTMDDVAEDPDGHRSGYLALVGRPNAGKSTLLNALLGQKLSIVSFKAQTTRHRVVGILSDPMYQVILVDTPGFILKMRNKLEEVMMIAVKRSLKDSDAVLVLIDLTIDYKEQLSMLAPPPNGPPTALVLNKIDTIPEEEREEMIQWFKDKTSASAVLPTCALTGEGLEALKEWAVSQMPEGPTLYPKDQVSEHPERFFVSEIIREKLFIQYEQEVPYSCQVNVVDFKERTKNKDFIGVHIIVERDAHRGILVGKGGTALKRLATASRLDIEEFLQRPVYLDISVKVVEGWRQDSNTLKKYGYN